ncbi:MAG: ATP-binding protein [Chloroflexi bacterium]|nr:ATP-binding protein [Chloroflexota bacterium]
MPNRRLQRQLIALLIVVTLVSIVAVGASVFIFVRQTEQEAWQGRQAEAAVNGAQRVEGSITQSTNGLLGLGDIDADLVRLFATFSPDAISNLIERNRGVIELLRVDADGEILISGGKDEPVLANTFTIPQSSWFLSTTDGERYLSDVQLTPDQLPYAIIAFPVNDGGAIAARLDMLFIWEVVASIQFGETGSAYVIDSDGNIIGHSNVDYAIRRENIAGRPELEAILEDTDRRWSGSYENFQGEDVVGSSAPIEGTDWIVVTELTEAEAFQTSQRAIRFLGVGALLFGVAVTVGTARILNTLVFSPVASLQSGADRIAQGDYTHKVPAKREDEIGQVAHAFNNMMTQLQERENQLVKQSQDLAVEVEERKRAEKIANQASAMKSAFLANVSHELRTPLNAIIGYVELLLLGMDGELTDSQRDKLTRVNVSSLRLLGIINDILDLSRIEAGRVDLVDEPFSPRAMLESIHKQMESLATEKNLNFQVQHDEQLPEQLMGDQKRIEQVVVNLLSNAFKFTEQGSVVVSTRVRDYTWQLVVEDTGIGIPAHVRETIFEPFRQAEEGSRRRFGGTGLGLSITRDLILTMGGNIRVDSNGKDGSTFVVTLPLNTPENHQDEPKPDTLAVGDEGV